MLNLALRFGNLAAMGAAVVAFLSDNFNDNSMDATKWTTGTFFNSGVTTGVTVAETNQHVEVTGPAASSGTHFSGYISLNTWDMTGQSIYLQLGHTASQGNEVFYLSFGPDVNNLYRVEVDSGVFYFAKVVAGTQTFFGSVGGIGWSPTTHKWLRLRHGGSGDDTVYVDAAPSTASNPPVSGDWVNLASAARDAGFAITASKLAFGGGNYASVTTPTVFIFDGFNSAT